MTNIPPNDGAPPRANDGAPPRVARVDAMTDENGSRIDVPNDSGLKTARDRDATVGAAGPTNWWLYGVIGLAVVIAIVLFMQMFSGAPGTDVESGTPTSEPVVETPAEAADDAAADPVVEAPADDAVVEEPADAAVDEPVDAAPAGAAPAETPAADAPATEAPAAETPVAPAQ